jgi:hypothetical protein
MFYASWDDGKTWTNTTVTNSEGVPVPAGTGDLVPTPALGAPTTRSRGCRPTRLTAAGSPSWCPAGPTWRYTSHAQ